MSNRFTDDYLSQLMKLEEIGQKRILPHPAHGINLSSNDYLGIGANRELIKQFYSTLPEEIESFALGSGSSRLLSGNHEEYRLLESDISAAYKKKSLVFSSGYHANTGIIPALVGRNDIIFSDKLNHASIVDGNILSKAKVVRYRHGDMTHLRTLLERYSSTDKKLFIITESIFSMDGDCAPLREIVALKKEFDCFLIVDEAHAVGVRGEKGLGFCEEQDSVSDVDLIVGTFGKALAGHGAFCVGDTAVIEWLVNKMRTLIFTTALPPVIIRWNRFIFNKMQAMHAERTHLKKLSRYLITSLQNRYEIPSHSHIIPLIVGENSKAVELAQSLSENGYITHAIRPPTVPIDTARIRISLSAILTKDDLEKLIERVS
ncbi:8-amino-7-oxononanoate synthase [bacterium]|nr:8-amino-7-oxononanoate synthase [bacterium]